MPTYNIKYTRELINKEPAVIITTPRNAVDYLKKNCFKDEDMWREKAVAVYLNNKNRVLGHQLVSIGGADSTYLDKKIVLKGALDSLAEAVIVAHNHPSGDCRPSNNDIRNTKGLNDACKVLDIQMLDHIILADKEFYSFSDEVVTQISK